MANQRIATGFPFPVYVNETNSSQSNAAGTYVDQMSAATAIGHFLIMLGVGT